MSSISSSLDSRLFSVAVFATGILSFRKLSGVSYPEPRDPKASVDIAGVPGRTGRAAVMYLYSACP
jgi:hypothetical protein